MVVSLLVEKILISIIPHYGAGSMFTSLSMISICLLPTGSEERGVLWVESIPLAILPSCQDVKLLRYNCINMNRFLIPIVRY